MDSIEHSERFEIDGPCEPRRAARARVVIVDDHPIVRDGLAAVLAREPLFEVVGSAATAASARECVREQRPDILVLDLALGPDDGIELAESLLKDQPNLRIVVLTMHQELEIADRLSEIGAAAYVNKGASCQEFLRALRSAVRGETYMTTEQRERAALTASFGKGRRPEQLLSSRELAVFRMLAEGRSSTQIADLLRVAVKTVHSHRRNMGIKLNVKNGRELIRYAVHWSRSSH